MTWYKILSLHQTCFRKMSLQEGLWLNSHVLCERGRDTILNIDRLNSFLIISQCQMQDHEKINKQGDIKTIMVNEKSDSKLKMFLLFFEGKYTEPLSSKSLDCAAYFSGMNCKPGRWLHEPQLPDTPWWWPWTPWTPWPRWPWSSWAS